MERPTGYSSRDNSPCPVFSLMIWLLYSLHCEPGTYFELYISSLILVVYNNNNAQVLVCGEDGSWLMVTVDETKPRGLAPPVFQRLLKTSTFHIVTLLLVLANAVTVATMNFDIRIRNGQNDLNGYYYAEVREHFRD